MARGLPLRLGGTFLEMGFLKHLGPLLREFAGFAWHHKVWWIVPLVIVFLVFQRQIVQGIAMTGLKG